METPFVSLVNPNFSCPVHGGAGLTFVREGRNLDWYQVGKPLLDSTSVKRRRKVSWEDTTVSWVRLQGSVLRDTTGNGR